MTYRDSLSSILEAGGDPATKAAVAGIAVLAANIWQAFTTLAFALVLLAAVADFVTGVARALKEHGMGGWDDRRAANAGLKLVVAGIIVAVTVGIDSAAHATGKVPEDVYAAFTAGCAIMTGIYLGSWARNANYFFPGIGEAVSRYLGKVGQQAPHDRRSGDERSVEP